MSAETQTTESLATARSSIWQHPIWLAGFRPFFFLAFIAGAIYPLLWALVFSGSLMLPAGGLTPVQWHAHEMLFGFGWAVLGGFLLTASKNWVHIRGINGWPLALAAGLWLIERAAVFAAPNLPAPLGFVLFNVFVLYVSGYVVWTLIRYRKQDTFPDNYFFVIALPMFLIAKNLMLSQEAFSYGAAMAIGLFRVAFAVMFERTMTQFMKNAMGATLLRNRYLDFAIKASILISVFQAWLPLPVAGAILTAAGTLLLIRFAFWKPLQGIKRFEIGIMYVGYLGLTMHLFAEAARVTGVFTGIGSLSFHIFTFLCMGVVIPGMLIRISQGHTGRKLLFTSTDRAGIWAMIAASFLRLVATQVWPANYSLWITLSALGWTICFAAIGLRLSPFLFKARIDGKVH